MIQYISTTGNNKKSRLSSHYLGLAVFSGTVLILSSFSNSFYQSILILLLFNVSIGLSWNILAGYGGQFSLGHAAFFGVGAYTSTILYTSYNLTPWAGLVLGSAAAALLGCIIGYPCFRLRGPFFTLATLAIAEILRVLAVTFKNVTGGSVGITIPFKPGLINMIFSEREHYLYLILIITSLIMIITIKLQNSKFGYQLMALRNNEDAASMMGINTTALKLWAMILSSGLMGVLGVFYAQYILYIEPDEIFSMNMSLQPALICIIGGVGTIWGPLVGSIILTSLSEFLRAQLGGSAHGLHLIIYAVLLLLVVTFIPQGILKWLQDISRGLIQLKRDVKVRNVNSK